MSYKLLLNLHMLSVIPCIFLGAYLLLAKKGGSNHRLLGKIYLLLMFFTAFVTLFLPAMVGPQFLGHFGWIHSFSFLTLYSVPTAYYAVRKKQIKRHQRIMVLLYVGAILIAGGFTLAPGRYLHTVFFGG
ncbi:MAG: DUF2306 domain-containing protein [Bacteroidota bacterium]